MNNTIYVQSVDFVDETNTYTPNTITRDGHLRRLLHRHTTNNHLHTLTTRPIKHKQSYILFAEPHSRLI